MFDLIHFNKNPLAKSNDSGFFNLFNNLIGELFNGEFMDSAAFIGNSLNMNARETADSYIIEANLPGVSKEALQVEYENDYLIICVKREDIVEDNRYEEPRRSRFYGEARRCFYAPNIDEENIRASLRNGRLTVELPKLKNYYKRKKEIDIR